MKKSTSKKIVLLLLSLFILSGCSTILGEVDPNNFEDVKKIISEDTGIPEEDIDLTSNEEIGQKESSIQHADSLDDNTEDAQEQDTQEETPLEPVREASILAVGDVLIHGPILRYARSQGGENSYDFSNNFARLKEFISKFDYSMANFEGASDPDRKFGGYPMFNVPREIFKNLKDAGFDGLYTANNHTLDAGAKGMTTTLEGISGAGLDSFGTQMPFEEHVKVIEVNGIKIGVLSYATSLNGLDSYLSNDEYKSQVNIYSDEKVKEDIETAKNMGADFVMVFPHWGVEYSSYPESYQINSSRFMIENGADIVIGGHPHVVQPSEEYTTESGHKGYILYSMGNFLSNQRKETLNGDIRTEQGVAVEVNLMLDPNTGEKELVSTKEHPLWVRRTSVNDDIRLHEVVLAEEYKPGGSKASEISESQQKRAEQAYDMTRKTLEKEIQN